MSSTTRQLEMSLRQMRAEVDRHKTEISRRPLRFATGTTLYAISIDQGNILNDGITKGIKNTGGSISTVPSLYDPNSVTTFIDGIGRGILYVNGVAQSGYVLVVNDNKVGSLITVALFQGDIVSTLWAPTFIPLASDNTQGVQAYVPYYL